MKSPLKAVIRSKRLTNIEGDFLPPQCGKRIVGIVLNWEANFKGDENAQNNVNHIK
jgi:hypothetical protein